MTVAFFMHAAEFMKARSVAVLTLAMFAVASAGCFSMRPSSGGGQTRFDAPRRLVPADVALPAGYTIEVVATGLTFPTGVAFDAAGTPHLVEAGYSYGEVWRTPRLLRIGSDGALSVVASGSDNGPWNGVTFHDGNFYVAEGGQRTGGRILRIDRSGSMTALVEDLPSVGDHHTNGPAIGPDGMLYFGQGTATNSGVVGVDNFEFGWLRRYRDFHDIPCRDVTLTGKNYTTANPLTGDERDRATTGAFSPFGTATSPGQVIRGRVPCNGAILKIPLAGGAPQLVAWGLRNPFGLAFSSRGELFVTDNQYDARGSRPVFGTGDLLWKVEEGKWHGWPERFGTLALHEHDSLAPPGDPRVARLIDPYPNDAVEPAARLGVHSASTGLDFSRSARFGHEGDAFIAQFGDMAPGVGKVLSPVGFKVVRVEVGEGIVHDFAVNRGETNGPASFIGGGGLERPTAVRFDPSGESLYVVDFGVMTVGPQGPEPRPETGVLWRIRRTR